MATSWFIHLDFQAPSQKLDSNVACCSVLEFIRSCFVLLPQHFLGPVRIDEAQKDGGDEPAHAGLDLEPGDICKPTVKTTRRFERR